MTVTQYVTASTLPVDSAAKDRIAAACAGTIDANKSLVYGACLTLAGELDACLPASAVDVVGPMVGRLRQVAVRAACGELPNATVAADVSGRMYQIRAAAIDGLALDGGS